MSLSLRLATWNLNGRTRALPGQIATLRSFEPDIVFLQEVTRATNRELAVQFAEAGYCHYVNTVNATATGSRKYAVAIASRLPIESMDFETCPIWPERLLVVKSDLGTFINTHMPTGCSHGLIKVDMLEAVFDEFATRSSAPTILAGDFNCPQEDIPELSTWAQTRIKDGSWRLKQSHGERWDRAERRFFDGTVQDAFRIVHGQIPACSWVLRRKEKTFPRRFDHIFISSHWKALSAEYRAIDRELSDHALLVVEVGRTSPTQ